MTDVRVIAEFGQACRGDLDTAMRQALVARDAGCWAVKYQCFQADRLVSTDARRYWDASLGGSDSQMETFVANGMLRPDEWAKLADYCRTIGVEFLATPFDLQAVDLLEDIGVNAYKVASGDLTYRQLLEKVAATGKPIILSTGASSAIEVRNALKWLAGCNVTLLACALAYPCPPEAASLWRIPFLASKFPRCAVGYSDHTLSPTTALAAAVLGADILEKHCRLEGAPGVPDDRMALSPPELAEYVHLAQSGAQMRGVRALYPSAQEMPARVGARRAIYATRDIAAGDMYALDDFAFLRPCPPDGYPPFMADQLAGTVARVDTPAGGMIRR